MSGEREPRGIQVGFLRNDAWDVAKNTGAAPHLAYDLVSKIVEIYAAQNDHRAVIQAYLQSLFTIVLEYEQKEEWHREGERAVINELMGIQKKLLERYQALMQLIPQYYEASLETDQRCSLIDPAA